MRSVFSCLLFVFVAVAFSYSATAEVNVIPYRYSTLDTVPKPNDTSSHELMVASKVFAKVEKEAEFPGGLEGWAIFLQRRLNSNVPVRKGAPAGKYTVVAQFIVDKEGNVSDITALTDHGYGMEEEVVRVLSKSPKWIPAILAGRRVNAYRKQPITFVVEEKVRRW